MALNTLKCNHLTTGLEGVKVVDFNRCLGRILHAVYSVFISVTNDKVICNCYDQLLRPGYIAADTHRSIMCAYSEQRSIVFRLISSQPKRITLSQAIQLSETACKTTQDGVKSQVKGKGQRALHSPGATFAHKC